MPIIIFSGLELRFKIESIVHIFSINSVLIMQELKVIIWNLSFRLYSNFTNSATKSALLLLSPSHVYITMEEHLVIMFTANN